MNNTSSINTKALVVGMALTLGIAGIGMVHAQSVQSAPERQVQDIDHDSDQPMSDTWITTKVKTELATTADVTSMDISVTTVNGVVTLTGKLESAAEVKRAVEAARSVEGVRNVEASGLTVQSPAREY